MKKTILILLLGIVSFSSNCQEFSKVAITKSKIFKDEYKNSYIELVVGDDAGGIILIRSYGGGTFSSGNGFYFERYDENLNRLKTYELKIPYAETSKQNSVLGLFIKDKKIHIIDFLYDIDLQSYICSEKTANISDFIFSTKELFKVQEKYLNYDYNNSNVLAKMILNENQSAFAISLDLADVGSETFQFYIYDIATGAKVVQKFKRENIDSKYYFQNITLDNDGKTLYVLGKIYKNELKEKEEGGKYQFELTQITPNAQKILNLETNEHFCDTLKTFILNNKITCVGFYSDIKDYRYKGIVVYNINVSNFTLTYSKFNKFTEQFLIDKYGKNKDKELRSLQFKSLIIASNNDIIFNAEEFYINSYSNFGTNNSFNGRYNKTTYNYNDIVTGRLNTDGDLLWARNINKRQSTKDDTEKLMSFTTNVIDSNIYFFINAAEKVTKISNDRIRFDDTTKNNSNLNIIRVDDNGNFDFKEILDDKENEVPFMVGNGSVYKNDTYFIGRKGKSKQILKITL